MWLLCNKLKNLLFGKKISKTDLYCARHNDKDKEQRTIKNDGFLGICYELNCNRIVILDYILIKL